MEKLLRARAMRRVPTGGEAMLWEQLRGRSVGGWKFRRQHVIAGYIVDFYCAELWLAIEVDGTIHDAQVDEDEQRDLHLALLGVDVLRVRDEDVRERLGEVVGAVAHRCEMLARQGGFAPKARRAPK